MVRSQLFCQLQEICDGLLTGSNRSPDIAQQHDAFGWSELLLGIAADGVERRRVVTRTGVAGRARHGGNPHATSGSTRPRAETYTHVPRRRAWPQFLVFILS